MKTLYLVRHGKAVGRDLDIPDYERLLASRGINDSFHVARKLRKAKIKPSLLISSPAPRAIQTARIFAKHLGCDDKPILTRKALYDQKGNALLRVVRTVGNKHDTIMLFGHDPSFSYFARFLIDDFDSDMPTCGVVGVSCGIDSWKEINQGTGALKVFEYPKALKKKVDYNSLRDDVEAILTDSIKEILMEASASAAEKNKKNIKECSQVLAKKFVKTLKNM